MTKVCVIPPTFILFNLFFFSRIAHHFWSILKLMVLSKVSSSRLGDIAEFIREPKRSGEIARKRMPCETSMQTKPFSLQADEVVTDLYGRVKH